MLSVYCVLSSGFHILRFIPEHIHLFQGGLFHRTVQFCELLLDIPEPAHEFLDRAAKRVFRVDLEES